MSQIDLIKGLGAKKKLGQNFLIDEQAIERELGYCNPKGKTVLEIGPGLGALTVGLARDAASLTAIEIDERFIPILKEKLREFPNAMVIQGDFLEFDGGPFDLIVSNIPYYIASKILFQLAEFEFKEAILCIQTELADRMLAEPGSRDYSRLSVMSQLYFEIEHLESLFPSDFYPQPEVSSSIVRLSKKNFVHLDGFADFVNAVFQHRNKKLRNAIIDSREMLGLTKAKATVLSSTLSLADRRVITLTKEEIVDSFKQFRRATR